MSERLTKERIEDIKARRDEAYRWITTLQMSDGRRKSEGLLVSAERDIDTLLSEVEALTADNERLRTRVAELEAPREGILATAQAMRLKVNTNIGQEGD